MRHKALATGGNEGSSCQFCGKHAGLLSCRILRCALSWQVPSLAQHILNQSWTPNQSVSKWVSKFLENCRETKCFNWFSSHKTQAFCRTTSRPRGGRGHRCAKLPEDQRQARLPLPTGNDVVPGFWTLWAIWRSPGASSWTQTLYTRPHLIWAAREDLKPEGFMETGVTVHLWMICLYLPNLSGDCP